MGGGWGRGLAAGVAAGLLGVGAALAVAACGEDREGGSVENIGGATTGTTGTTPTTGTTATTEGATTGETTESTSPETTGTTDAE